MKDMHSPPRLLDASDTSEALRSSLRVAREDMVDADAAEQIAAGVIAQVGPPGAGPAGGGHAAGHGAGFWGGVLAAGAGVVLLGGGLWLAAGPDRPQEHAAPPCVSPAASAQRVEPVTAPPPPPEEPVAAPSMPTSSANPRTPSPRSTAEPKAERSPVSTLAEEHRLLRAARGALDADPNRALALARDHERRFPQGVLSQEREVIAIQALRAMGEAEAAKERTDGFEKQYPDSPHRHVIDAGAAPIEK